MLVSHNLNGVRWHCFRCGENHFIPHGKSALADILRREKEYQDSIRKAKTLRLPEDCEPVPEHLAHWYLQYGVSYETAQCYEFCYSPGIERIIMPVYEPMKAGPILTNIQMRATRDGQKPKYITPGAKYYPSAIFWCKPFDRPGPLVVCEDMLSAIRVNAVTRACSILGSSMNSDRAFKISEQTNDVLIWLDGDAAGLAGAAQSKNALALYGVEARIIHTAKDPKEYSTKEISQIIEAHL